MNFWPHLVTKGRRHWHPTPVLLPGNSHGQRRLVGCSPRGRKESDRTERLHFHFSLSCIGEENDNPLQCSCLENPRDGGAWWAAIYGVTQSSRLKWLSSSSDQGIRQLCLKLQELSPGHRVATDLSDLSSGPEVCWVLYSGCCCGHSRSSFASWSESQPRSDGFQSLATPGVLPLEYGSFSSKPEASLNSLSQQRI